MNLKWHQGGTFMTVRGSCSFQFSPSHWFDLFSPHACVESAACRFHKAVAAQSLRFHQITPLNCCWSTERRSRSLRDLGSTYLLCQPTTYEDTAPPSPNVTQHEVFKISELVKYKVSSTRDPPDPADGDTLFGVKRHGH